MRLTYAVFHSFVHLVTPFLLWYFFNLSFENFLIVFLTTFIIDLDHLCYFNKKGFRHWLDTVLKFREGKSYPLHNLYLFLISLFGVFLLLIPQYYKLGLVFVAFFLHMLWDLFEDTVIFKIGIKNWL